MTTEEKLQELINKAPERVYCDDVYFFIFDHGEILEMPAGEDYTGGTYIPEIYDAGGGDLYYLWEGEVIQLYDNVRTAGEPRGTYDDYSDEDWIDILENLDQYKVTGEYRDPYEEEEDEEEDCDSEEEDCYIRSVRFEVVKPVEGIVAVEAEFEKAYLYPGYALLVEVEGEPNFYMSEESLFDLQKKDELNEDERDLMEDGFIETGDYEDIFACPDAEDYDLFRMLITICRADEEDTKKFIDEVTGCWLSEIVLPASDVEEEFGEKQKGEN